MVQAICLWPLPIEAMVRSQAIPSGIRSKKSGAGTRTSFMVFLSPALSTTTHSFVVFAMHSIVNNACKCIFPDRLMKITKYFVRINVWRSERIGSG